MDASLQLRTVDPEEGTRDRLREGVHLTLYSDHFDRELTVKLTHREGEELGGNLVAPTDHPLLGKGDHLHFTVRNVMEVRGDTTEE